MVEVGCTETEGETSESRAEVVQRTVFGIVDLSFVDFNEGNSGAGTIIQGEGRIAVTTRDTTGSDVEGRSSVCATGILVECDCTEVTGDGGLGSTNGTVTDVDVLADCQAIVGGAGHRNGDVVGCLEVTVRSLSCVVIADRHVTPFDATGDGDFSIGNGYGTGDGGESSCCKKNLTHG